MIKKSAGLLPYRIVNSSLEFLLVHPGGPFWAKKDLGVWSLAKGEFEADEDPLEAAKREFKEETGYAISGKFIPLSPLKQKTGKIIYAWAVEADIEIKQLESNFFEIEWPPRSGKTKQFPEVDKAEWFDIKNAIEKINPGQVGFLKECEVLTRKTNQNP